MDDDDGRRRQPEGASPLPPERAFVVQLRAPTHLTGELFVGRAEHLASGAVGRFSCAAELLAFMTAALASPATAGGEASPAPATDQPFEDVSPSTKTTR